MEPERPRSDDAGGALSHGLDGGAAHTPRTRHHGREERRDAEAREYPGNAVDGGRVVGEFRGQVGPAGTVALQVDESRGDDRSRDVDDVPRGHLEVRGVDVGGVGDRPDPVAVEHQIDTPEVTVHHHVTADHTADGLAPRSAHGVTAPTPLPAAPVPAVPGPRAVPWAGSMRVVPGRRRSTT